MINKLPMKFDDLLDTYNVDASFIAMVSSYPNTESWIYSSFIQIKGFNDNVQPFFYESQFDRDTPFFTIQRMSRTLVDMKWNIVDFLIDCIDNNYYSFFLINKKEVSLFNYNHDFYHDISVYGYNIYKKVFYIAANFDDGKYKYDQECSFEEMRLAYENINANEMLDWPRGIVLYKYTPEESHKVDQDLYNRVGKLLNHYIQSTDMYEYDFLLAHHARENIIFGQDIYRNVIKHLKNSIQEESIIDIKPFHFFYSHKKFMKRRFEYLIENKIFSIGDNDLKLFDLLIYQSNVHRNLILKYNLTMNSAILIKIINQLQQFITDENNFYKKILIDNKWEMFSY